MTERWLKCSILKGMFSDEYAIKLGTEKDPMSFFVPREMVRGNINEKGQVKVRVMLEGKDPLAVLPTCEQSIIPVSGQDLVEA